MCPQILMLEPKPPGPHNVTVFRAGPSKRSLGWILTRRDWGPHNKRSSDTDLHRGLAT